MIRHGDNVLFGKPWPKLERPARPLVDAPETPEQADFLDDLAEIARLAAPRRGAWHRWAET